MQKVLIILYYWPPAGGPGVQRWLKFVKYLGSCKIEPIVYVPENPNYPIQDNTFVDQIPKGVKILKQPIFEPYRLAGLLSKKKTKRISSGIIQTKNPSFLEKVMLWIRGNFFIPDARKFWIKPSVRYLSKVLMKEDIKTIITTGPPHSMHLIGYHLKANLGVEWIADFRDPWTTIGYHKKLRLTKRSAQKHKRLEKDVLQAADKIVVTSNTTKKEFAAITKKPIKVITNGYDGALDLTKKLDVKFSISHIGSLLSGRNPSNLWRVLGELVTENIAFREQLKLQFVGVVSEDVLASIHASGLEVYLDLKGYVSHEEAIKYQQSSQLLLLVEIDSKETEGIIPGKLFEYMHARRPILGLGPKNWEAGDIISATNSGAVFDYKSDSDLKSLLLNWFNQYQQNRLVTASTQVDKYSRKELTEELAKYIRWESY